LQVVFHDTLCSGTVVFDKPGELYTNDVFYTNDALSSKVTTSCYLLGDTNNYNGLQQTAKGVKMINLPQCVKAKGSLYSITERRVPELIPLFGSQPAGNVSHKPGGRLPLISARPAVTPATLKRVATNFAAW